MNKPKKERSPWLWLLLIPAQLAIAAASLPVGAALDAAIFSGGEGQGHGMPVFSVLLPAAALVVTAAAAVVALTGLTVSLVRRARRRRARARQDGPDRPLP